MINFITGRCGSGKSKLVCDSIVNEITNGNRNVVLLVPEQQTVVWETKMASILPPSSNLRLEITNFTRLANSVFREFGGLADSVVDEGTRSLLVWRAMLSVWDQLQVYSSPKSGDDQSKYRHSRESDISREDKNIPSLLAAIDELKNSGISPSDAEKALDSLTSEHESQRIKGGLSSRLSDAVLVYSAYQTFLHEEYIDRGDLLENLAAALAKHPYFKNKAVFIDSFFSLTRGEEKILSQIIKQADDVTVTFTCPPKNHPLSQKNAAAEQLSFAKPAATEEITFHEVEKYRRTVLSIAIRWGKEINNIDLFENHRHSTSPELSAVEKHLFDYTSDLPKCEDCPRDVEIIQCADTYDEAEACAAIISRLVRDGYRFSDIAVVARNMKTREGIIDRTLRSHGIRCFMSENGDVSSLPAVRLVTAALAVAANGWQRKDLISLLKTGMTAVGRNVIVTDSEFSDTVEADQTADCCDTNEISYDINTAFEGDIFEIYTETWNLRGKRAYTSGAWSMNPAGYKIERSEEGNAMLRAANRAREKLVLPLERFLSVFDDGEANVRDIAERIVYYAEECRVTDALKNAAETYSKLGMDADAKKTLSSWDKVCKILDCMVKNLGDCKLSAGRFAGLFSRVAASMDVGSIPTGIDEVILGSASGVRTDSVKCVIILGAVDGEFPGSVSDTGAFFSERDKLALEAVGLNIASPDLSVRSAREMFMFYRTASAASEKLFILTPSADTSQLSEGAVRIGEIVKSVRNASCIRKFAEMPLSDTVFTRSAAEYLFSRRTDDSEKALLRALSDGKSCPEHTIMEDQLDLTPQESVKNAQTILTSKISSKSNIEPNRTPRLNLSQSKIESFVRCPFSYWSKYEMKLAPTPVAEIKAPDIGTFLHSVLEHFFRRTSADSLPLTREETEKLADEVIENYISALAASGLGEASRGVSSLRDGRLEYLFLRLRRHVLVFLEAIMRELEQSKFRPVAFELPIGISSNDGKNIEAMSVQTSQGVDVTIRGIADRADIYTSPDGQKYLRIVDYKTGNKTFSLEEVKHGLHLQMLIYLFSLKHHGDKTGDAVIPSGALYFVAKPSSVTEVNEPSPSDAIDMAIDKIERIGVLLSDEDVLRAMDSDLSGKYLKVKSS